MRRNASCIGKKGKQRLGKVQDRVVRREIAQFNKWSREQICSTAPTRVMRLPFKQRIWKADTRANQLVLFTQRI